MKTSAISGLNNNVQFKSVEKAEVENTPVETKKGGKGKIALALGALGALGDMNTLAKVHDGTIVDCPSPCERPRRLGAVKGEPIAEHKVVYSDIDFNRHMNTMRYIDIIFDTLPIEVPEHLNGFRLDMNFVKEARYGDNLPVPSRAPA